MTAERVGVLIGVVSRLDDGKQEGRVEVTFPTFADSLPSYWAPVAAPMAGGDRGFRFAPRVGDECLVAFDRGDPDRPYIIGFLHNGVDRPPSANPEERIIGSYQGHVILFDDGARGAGDKGRLTVRDAHGNVLEMRNSSVTLQARGQLDIKAPILTLNGRPVVSGKGTI